MDKRISTALIAVSDIFVAMLIPLAVALVLSVVAVLRLPEPYPGAGLYAAYTAAREAALAEYSRDPDAFMQARRGVVLILLAAQSLGLVVAGWWFRRRRPVADWEIPDGRVLSWDGAIGKGVVVGFGAMLASVAVNIPIMILLGIDAVEQPELESLANMEGPALLFFILLATVIGPVGEEVFFRGHLFRWSAGRCGVVYAYLLTGLLFSLMHFNLPGVPAYLTIAVILGWSYQRWGTLVVPITAHITLNAVAISSLVLR